MNALKDLPHPIREVTHDWIPLADGTRLAVRYWLPEDAEENPVPGILEYIPYCKRDGTAARDEAMHPYFAGQGYASLRVDLRGAGESEGVMLDEYLQQEHDDAVEVIAWIAAQPWCSGKVGMFGKSWGGFNCLQVAALQPPALKCLISVDGTDDRYADDIHYMGGCMNVSNATWAFSMFQRIARPPDPDAFGKGWREAWMKRLEVARPWLIDWVKHQRRDEFWQHGSVCEDYSRITCPVYAVGGWSDSYTNMVLRMMEGLDVPRKAIIGPWGHQYPHQGKPGPAIGYLQDATRWWDHWLKDLDTGMMAEPMIRFWLQDNVPPAAQYAHRPGRWAVEAEWPPSDYTEKRFSLASDGKLGDAAGEGDIPVSTPQTLGEGAVSWIGGGAGQPDEPTDQRSDDAKSVCFETPIDKDFDSFGGPVLDLEVSADKPCAFLCARLCEVTPDGASSRISYGLLNLTHRDSHEHPEPLEPRKRYRVTLRLNDIGHRFTAGNRLRLALSTSYWPIIWPMPEAATVTLHLENCRLTLPERPERARDAELSEFGPPVSTPVQPTTILRAIHPQEVQVIRDVRTGNVTTRQVNDAGHYRIDATGWEVGGSGLREREIAEDDPTTAECRSSAVNEWGRAGEHHFRVETEQVMSCDAQDFIIEAAMRVYEDGRPVMSKAWLERVKRDLV